LRSVSASPLFEQGEIAVFTDAVAEGSRVVIAPPVPVIDGQLLDPHPDDAIMSRLMGKGVPQ
jgi:hypothetical protein